MQKIGLEAVLEMANFNQGLKGYTSGIDQMEDKTEKGASVLSKIGGVMGGLAKVGIGAAIAGFGALTAVIGSSIGEAAAAQQVEAQLDAVLQSTGGAAGMTKEEILGLAEALSTVTPFEDEVIASAETMLLQFKAIGEDVFPQATEMALDLAQRLGIDASSAAKLLGKALEEPGEGLLRLKQAGVAFSDEQEAMIKKMVEAGDTAGAQKYIMDELQKSVGGAARAAGETFAGKMEILQNKIGNVKEAIGTAFLPVLTTLVDTFSQFVTDNGPQIQAFFQGVADFIVNDLIPGFVLLVGWVRDNLIPAIKEIAAWFSGEGSSSLSSFATKITDSLGPAIAFAQQLFEILVSWVQENWPLIQETVSTVMQAIGTVISTVLGAIASFWSEHGAAIMAYVSNLWEIIKTIITTAINVVLGVIKVVMQLINGDWAGAWETIKGIVVTVWEAIKSIVGLAIENIKIVFETAKSVLGKIWDRLWTAIRTGAETAWDKLVAAVSGWISDFVGKFEALKESIIGIGKSIVDGIKQGIENAWDSFVSWVLGLVGGIVDAILGSIGGGSPAKAFMPIGESMAQGIGAGWERALAGLSLPGMGTPALAFAGYSPPDMSGSGTTNNTSYGGDTIILNVASGEAWGMAQRWVDTRRRARLNAGM